MRSRTATWFECRIAFEKTMEDGLQKRVTDKYVKSATPELRQQLIDKLTAMRENGQIPQK